MENLVLGNQAVSPCQIYSIPLSNIRYRVHTGCESSLVCRLRNYGVTRVELTLEQAVTLFTKESIATMIHVRVIAIDMHHLQMEVSVIVHACYCHSGVFHCRAAKNTVHNGG